MIVWLYIPELSFSLKDIMHKTTKGKNAVAEEDNIQVHFSPFLVSRLASSASEASVRATSIRTQHQRVCVRS